MYRRHMILVIVISFLMMSVNSSIGICKSKSSPEKDDFYEEIELFTDAITLIQSEYVNETNMKDLIYGALRGMLSSLDPYSQFMDPDTYNEIKVETEGEFGGLGIEITIKDGLLTVIAPLDDTPAWKAGLKAGDKIVKIDGELTRDVTLLEAVKKLRGKPGTQVVLVIMRENENKLLDFTITRDIIKIKSIKEAVLLEDKIGYIRLSEFQENTPKELGDALFGLEEQGMDGLILDLRNNPGGLLDVAVQVTDKFIEGGKTIVSTRGRNGNQFLEFKSHSKTAYPNYPLVVLINGGSASGSEIVAGAVQDNGRGILLGTKTFGKGSVQTVIPLSDGSAVRLTTSKYFTPKGRSIHGEGITPDVVVELEETKSPEKADLTADVFERLERKEEGVDETKEETEKKVRDNQITRAIDLLKGIKVYRALEKK